MLKLILLTATIAIATFAGIASAQQAAGAPNQFDGKWSGTAGQWTIKLDVKGTKANITMSCSNDFTGTLKVGPNGTIDDYMTTGQSRRRINGSLPVLNIEPSGTCGGGTVTLAR